MNMDIMLHDHLDGSYPLLSILPEMWRMTHGADKSYPFNPWADHGGQVSKWFNDVHRDIVEKFSITTGVMQDIDTLYLAGKTYTEHRARQGYHYCEARIAPQYHTFLGLTEKQVIDALIRGIKRGEKKYPGIEVNLIYSFGRELSADRAVNQVMIAGECDRDYVVGVDMVCDEAENPPEKHKMAFHMARIIKLKKSCHAGEWVKNRKPEEKLTPEQLQKNFDEDLPLLVKNIRTAVFGLKVDRIGHAIGLPYDQELMQYVKDRKIGVEGCPGSNKETGVIPDLECLRIREIFEAGILYSMNSDDDLFLPDLDSTIQMCHYAYRFTDDELEKIRVNAWKTRFGCRKPVPADIATML